MERWRGWPLPALHQGGILRASLTGVPQREEHVRITALQISDQTSVSTNKHEFVADILNINGSAIHINRGRLCSGAGAVPGCSTAADATHGPTGLVKWQFPPLTVSFMAWKSSFSPFPQSEDTVIQYKSETEKGNSYFKLTTSTPQLLHPFASLTSRSLWHCHLTYQRHMHEKALGLPKHVHKLPKSPPPNWLQLCRRTWEQRDLSATCQTISVSQTLHMNAFPPHETKAPCTWKTKKHTKK